MPAQTFSDALERAKRLGYRNFSHYIAYLIERDLAERPQHFVVREEAGGK